MANTEAVSNDEQEYKDYVEYQKYQAMHSATSPGEAAVAVQAIDDHSYGPQPEPDLSAAKSYVEKNVNSHIESQKESLGKKEYAQNWQDAFLAGLQMSSTGLMVHGAPTSVLPEHADRAMRIAANLGQTIGDLPEIGIATAGTTLATGNPVAGLSAGFAVPAGIRKLLMDHYEKGDMKSAGDFVDRLMGTAWETTKGAVTGALTAVSGGIFGQAAGTVGKLAGEYATMTTVGAALEGRLPTPDEFIDGAVVLGGLHAVSHVTPKLREIYAKTGQRPSEIVDAATKDVQLKQDILSPNPELPKIAEPSGESVSVTPPEGQTINPEKSAPAEVAVPRSEAMDRVLSKIVEKPEFKTPGVSIDDIIVAVKDDLNPIKQLVESVDTKSEHLEPSKNPYILARTFRDWAGKLVTTFERATIDYDSPTTFTGEGLIPIIKDIPEGDVNAMNGYMYAKRAIEKAAQGKNVGLSLEDAKAVVAEHEKEFEPVFRRMVDFTSRVMQYAVDSGILSEEKRTLFEEKNKDYAPLYRELGVDPLTGAPSGKKKLFQAIGESEKNVINPIRSIFENTAAIMKAAEENRVKRALIEIPDLVESGNAQKVEEPGPLRKNEISVKINGETEKWAFQPEVATAIKAMDYSPVFTSQWAKFFTEPFKMAAKGLRFGVTGDPGFAVRHIFRASVAAEIQTDHPNIPFIGTIHAMGDIFEKSDDFYKFIASGGANGSLEQVRKMLDGRVWENPDLVKGGVKEIVKNHVWPDTDDTMVKKAWNAVMSPLALSHTLTGLGDMAPRLAEFKKLGGLDGDLNKQIEAGFAARNVTVDYLRQGALTKMVSFAQPFLNVDMQGTYRALEGLLKPKTIAMATAMITLPEIVNFALNHDDERYKNAPLWEHAAFMLVPITHWKKASEQEATIMAMTTLDKDLSSVVRKAPDGSFEINDGPMLRIPRAFTLGLIYGSIPHMLLDSYKNHNPNAFDNLREQISKAILPAGMTALLQPAIEQATNYQFFQKRELVPATMEKYLPAYRVEPYTSEVAKQLGKVLGHLPQIGPDKAPLASPIVIDNYIRAWGGTAGGWMVNILDRAIHAAGVGKETEVQEKDWTQLPVVREFFSHFPASKPQAVVDFRNDFSKIDQKVQTEKMLSGGDVEAFEKVVDTSSSELAKIYQIDKSLRLASTAISKTIRALDKSPADKREIINIISFQMMVMSEEGKKLISQYKKQGRGTMTQGE